MKKRIFHVHQLNIKEGIYLLFFIHPPPPISKNRLVDKAESKKHLNCLLQMNKMMNHLKKIQTILMN